MPSRNGETEHDSRERFGLYRLCDCTACGGSGKEHNAIPRRCSECRGEGRIRQEVASCESPEAVGVAIVTLAREGEWDECPFGLLDREPPCEGCGGYGEQMNWLVGDMMPCAKCKGSGVKPTGTWLVSPWLPSARNVTDAARTLARSKKPRPKGL